MSGPPDGMPDGPDAAASTITVSVTSTADLRLIAFRDGPSAPWQTPAATAPGRYQFMVHGPYTVLDVCAAQETVVEFARSRTPDDPREFVMSCLTPSPPQGSHVTGSITLLPGTAESTHVHIGPSAISSPMPDGTFDVEVGDGTYDLTVRTLSSTASQDRTVIRRNVVVTGDTVVMPAIDVATEGTAAVLVQPTVTNLGVDERTIMTSEVHTPTVTTGVSLIGGVGFHVLPDAALGPGDFQRIALTGNTSHDLMSFSGRTVDRLYTETTSLEFTLPPAISAPYTVIDGQAVATWTTLPPFDRLRFTVGQDVANSAGLLPLQVTELSASYVTAVGATSARFDTDVPGFDPSWRIDVTLAWDHEAEALRTVGGELLSSSQFEEIVL